MRLKTLVPVAALAALAGCDSILDVQPSNQVAEETAVNSPAKARSAVAGMYDALQSGSYYGGDFVLFMDLSSDNAAHSGTFTTFADADRARVTPDNSTIEGIWDALYRTIGRANIVIERVPGITALTDAEKNDMLGQARALRALSYHNLLKVWGTSGPNGGVPVRTTPPTTVSEASNITRTDSGAVYTQIMNDLNSAISSISNTTRTRATATFARALRARVNLYRGQWTAARDDAAAVINTPGYSLAPTFGALFTPTGNATNEDILRLAFTDVEFMNLGFYYLRRSLGGRQEMAPTLDLFNSFETGDARRNLTIGLSGTARYGAKFPTPIGAEDFHVIRLAEVILIKAEAHARLGELALAVTEYNKVRVRAGLAPHVLGVNVITQADVLNAIHRERRSELALEGDRWPDLIRRGVVISTMTSHLGTFPTHQALYPIPQNELDVAPGLTQQPGY
jgi:starch-binding outer membrane protein, SusD/RagB family